jgi:hypothetical protein
MSLWSNIEAATSVPKFAPSLVNLSNTQDNSNLVFANTTVNAFVTGGTIGVFAVAPNEMIGQGNVSTITVSTAGTGYTARPTLTITGANTDQATATAVGAVVSASITANGTGYFVGNTFTATAGTGTGAILTVTSVGATGNVTGVSITNPGAYTVLPTLVDNPFTANTGSGSGFRANLAIGVGATVTVTGAGTGYNRDTIGVTFAGTGGTGSAASVTLTGQEGVTKKPTAGWNLRTAGSGGRAGRVHYECLVAMGSMTGDTADDSVLAE